MVVQNALSIYSNISIRFTVIEFRQVQINRAIYFVFKKLYLASEHWIYFKIYRSLLILKYFKQNNQAGL